MKLAVQHNIPFLATGRRHGYTTTLGELQEGLAIDLSQLNSFEADTEANTITVGGASGAGEFQDELYAAGLLVPHGSCACPGYVGLSVGGGVGRYMGSLGLVSDRLLSASVVTSTGDIVTISESENTDLFWGMRGAGANFGIITSATYQAAKTSDHSDGYVLNCDLHFFSNATAAYFAYLDSVDATLPGNVGGVHITLYNTTTDSVS